jgi:diguanylate cyclase (GGDEF)-like protein
LRAELEQERRHLEGTAADALRLAEVDLLTGLGNRRRLERFVGEAEATSTHVALVMADVDHFKDVNDTFDHDIGDAVLRALGQLFSAEAWPGQLAVRYAGEEFLFVMLDVDMTAATTFAERLRARAARAWPELPDHQRLTVSVGVARGTLTTWRSVVVAADQALSEQSAFVTGLSWRLPPRAKPSAGRHPPAFERGKAVRWRCR